MSPGPTHPTATHLTQDQLDALERTYQSQMISLILGHSDPAQAKRTLDTLSEHLTVNDRDPVNIIAGATKIAQGILGLRRE